MTIPPEMIEAVARAMAPHMEGGREYDQMPPDRIALRKWSREGMCLINDATQDDAREAADAAIRTLAPMMAEVMAEVADKRADDRFAEHGVTEYDTNASYYSGSRAEAYDELDEEDWAIARDIRAKGKEMADG